jgi:hypothetical protein
MSDERIAEEYAAARIYDDHIDPHCDEQIRSIVLELKRVRADAQPLPVWMALDDAIRKLEALL